MPVVDSVCEVRLKLPLLVVEVKVLLFGSFRLTVIRPMLLLVMCTVTCWFAVPEKVMLAFCPRVEIVTVSGDPLTVTVPVASTML